MPNYDLGTAHGQIIIDYDSKGTSQASESFDSLGKDSDNLKSHINGLGNTLSDVSRNFGSIAQNFGRNFALMAGGASVLGLITLQARGLTSGLLGMRTGISILSNLRTVIGGVPKSIQGFPNVLKQIVLLSAGIGLLGGGLKILQDLAGRFQSLNGAVPILQRLRTGLEDVTKPVKDISKLILTIGTFITAVKGVLDLTRAVAKMTAVLGSLGSGIQLVAELGSALTQLSGAALLLPAVLGGAALAFGTMAIGIHGFSQAIKDSGDPKKFAADLEGLAPSAQDAARAIVGLKGQFSGLQLDVQQALFEGLGDDIRDLGKTYIPILSTGLKNIAGDMNQFADQSAKFFLFPSVASDISKFINNIHIALGNLIPAWDAMLRVMDDIGTVGSSFLPELANDIGQAADRFANFIDQARATGQLAGWIQTGIDAFKLLGSILYNVIEIVKTFFSAFQSNGAGLLNTLDSLTGSLMTFLKSAQGSEALQSLAKILGDFSRVLQTVLLEALKQLAPIIVDLLPFIRDLAQDFGGTMVASLKVIGPLLDGMAKALSAIGPVITPFVGALLAIGTYALIAGTAIKTITTAITLLNLGIKVIQGTIIIFRSVILSLQVAFWLLDASALPLSATIGLIAIAVLLAAAVIVVAVLLIIKYWTQIKDFFIMIWSYIAGAAKAIWEPIASFFSNLWSSISSWAVNTWNTIWSDVQGVWNRIVSFFQGLGSSIGGAFSAIGSTISGIWNGLIGFFEALPGRIGGFIVGLVSKIGTWLTSIPTGFSNAMEQGLEWVIAEIIALPIQIFAILRAIPGQIATFFETTGAAIGGAVVNLLTEIANFFAQLPGRILTAISSFNQQFVDWVVNAWTNMQIWAGQKTLEFITWVTGLPGQIIAAVSSFNQEFVDWIVNSWEAMKNWAIQKNLEFVAWVRGIPGDIINGISNFNTMLGNWARDAWTWMKNTAVGVFQDMLAWARSVPGQLLSSVGNLGNLLYGVGRDIINGLWNGVKAVWASFQSFISGIADKVKTLVQSALGIHSPSTVMHALGIYTMQGFLNGFKALAPTLYDYVKGIAQNVSTSMSANVDLGVGATGGLGATRSATVAAMAAATGVALAPAGTAARAASGTSSPAPAPMQVSIANVNVAGNIDPSDPVRYRQTLKNFKNDLRDLERSAS